MNNSRYEVYLGGKLVGHAINLEVSGDVITADITLLPDSPTPPSFDGAELSYSLPALPRLPGPDGKVSEP